MKTLILALLFSVPVFGSEVELDSGESLNVITMQGHVNVRCQSGQYPTTRFYQCFSSNIEGGNYSRLNILNDIGANRVSLYNFDTKVGKTLKINQSTMQTGKINLWINTLTQRALLGIGNNTIGYKLMKDNTILSEAPFAVNVSVSEERRCPTGFLNYHGRMCPDKYSACSSYFYQYRYCK